MLWLWPRKSEEHVENRDMDAEFEWKEVGERELL